MYCSTFLKIIILMVSFIEMIKVGERIIEFVSFFFLGGLGNFSRSVSWIEWYG